jgi:hypothetical protein
MLPHARQNVSSVKKGKYSESGSVRGLAILKFKTYNLESL